MPSVLLYITTSGRDEAARIAECLVAERLVACANILPGMESVYWWNGRIAHGNEAVLIAKTDRRNVEMVTARIVDLHGDETPCVVALPIETGNADFLTWVERESTAWDDGRMG